MAQCVAILAPSGRDAQVIERILRTASIDCLITECVETLLQALRRGSAGALVVAEEALNPSALSEISGWLSTQPPWSDLPILLLTMRSNPEVASSHWIDRLGNVTLLERPLRPPTLVSAARAALRARKRQHEAERYIAEAAAKSEALRFSETSYRTLFNSIDEGFCVIEFVDGPHGPVSDYVHVEANAAFERHAGMSNVVGQQVRAMLGEEALGWIELYGEVLRTGNPIRFERELVATGRYLELAAFRIEPPGLRQVAVLFQDVTARKRAEERLRKLNETLEQRVAEALTEKKFFADIVEGSDAFVQVADRDFRWLAINKASANQFERIYGVRPKVGESMVDLLADQPEHQTAVKAVWGRALAGEEFTEIAEFGDPGRDRRYFEMKFNSLRGPDGAIIGAYQFVYDVTERLRDQERLAEATARMHEMAKLETLGQLTGGVAHDFNNLLTPIVGALDLLRRRYEKDERSLRLISNALQGAERATVLVQRLLTFARRQHLEARAVDVGSLLAGLRDLLERSIGPRTPIAVNVAQDLPPARVDPNQLELAILNLAVNARDAMPEGGTLAIEVGEGDPAARDALDLQPGRYIRLSVTDTGSGMSDETLKRAIEPFFTTKGQGKGTGLGLSMVHGLAAQSGGTLAIRSRVGEGTTAELWLPVAEDGEAIQSAAEVADVRVASPRSARILLVDDEVLVRVGTAEMLRGMGHEVTEVGEPTEALAHIRSGTEMDLMITDHLMPQMTGAALIQEARRTRPRLPVLLVTGYATLGSEAVEFPRLAKPYREADLATAVAEALQGTRYSAETS